MDELWMVHDVAKDLGVSDDAVRYYERHGQLPAVRTPGGVRLFRQEDVAAFKAKRAATDAEVAYVPAE